jgi:thiol-disulfide isomerase/thioredoxin
MSDNSNLKKNLAVSFRILLSVLFLLSAVAKLYPSPYFALTTFEIKQLLPLGFNETVAAYFSRSLIGCELALGILLLQPHFYKRLVLPMSFLILFIFSTHLSYEILATGNSGNCGCFGSLLPMTPLQALIKNIIAMGMIGYLYKTSNKSHDKRNFSFIMAITFASILFIYLVGPIRPETTPTIIEMPEIEAPINNEKAPVIDTLSLPSSQVSDNTKLVEVNEVKIVEEPKQKKSGFNTLFPDIDKGKKILCFFAPGCDHCKETAKELTQLKKQNANFPELKIVFMDEEAEIIPDFFTYAGAKYPYQIVDIASFWKTLGGTKDTPGVFYLWNGNIIKEYNGINESKFVKNEFKKIVSKAYAELK